MLKMLLLHKNLFIGNVNHQAGSVPDVIVINVDYFSILTSGTEYDLMTSTKKLSFY